MSHFIGLVFINPDYQDVDMVLEPFNEQDEEYMEFVDKTDEVKAGFEKLPEDCPTEGTFTEEIDRTDMVNEIWDNAADEPEEGSEDKFWKPYTKKEFPTPTDIAKDKNYRIVEDETKRDGVRFVQDVERKWEYEPSKAKYPTLDKFAKDYYGYRKINGRYGYMSNPNAKYDWYMDGGRWDGYLINKEGNKTNEDFLTEIDWDKVDIPFCFIGTDEVWREKGEMGWWAMVSNEKPQNDWDAEFKDYVNTLLAREDADRIVVYAIDFHI
jgi:hypothetical protein